MKFSSKVKLLSMSTNIIISYILILFFSGNILAQTSYDVPVGSFLTNMGVVPQTVGNGLKPYGMVYDLIKNYGVTVIWSIKPDKLKDGIDFSHNGVDYKGGSFIIPAPFRTAAVNAAIASWQAQGVVGATSVSPFSVPLHVAYNLTTIPRWTLDEQNGSIATGYFANAGIPPEAYGGSNSSNWKIPAALDCCDDLFVMPHADPVWATHQRLLSWNLECKGAIWAACHAVSALENMLNPANRDQQLNFLTVKDPAWKGTSGNYAISNSLILWGDHSGGSIPYTHRLPGDPVAQYLGVTDGAQLNGSEQIYIPRQGIVSDPTVYNPSAVSGWNPSAKIIAYDPTQSDVTNLSPDLKNAAAVIVYGRGFEDNNRGMVMYESGHSHNKSTGPDNIAAQRAFFNFGFLVASEKAFTPNISGLPSVFASGAATSLTYTVTPANTYITHWASTCGGTFSPNNTTNSNPTTFTAPLVSTPTPCNISIVISDPCGRQVNATQVAIIQPCTLGFNNTINNAVCYGSSTGSINMEITGSVEPYSWNWSRVSPAGNDAGSGTIISNLSAGTYNVTVTAPGGCSGTFSSVINQPTTLSLSTTKTDVICNGQSTGAINLTVTGGTPPYTYLWNDGPTTKNRSNIPAGSYTVTVTDANFCTANISETVNENPGMTLTASITNVSCYGTSTGAINLSVTGAQGTTSYIWSTGAATEDVSGLAAGNYSVTVSDGSGCSTTATYNVSQPANQLLATAITTNTNCNGSNNGSINLTPAGGTPAYTFSWSSGQTTENISGLLPGAYTVTVTDSKNCVFTLTEVITQPTALSLSTEVTNSTCPTDNGLIDLTVIGGTAPYTYDWSNNGLQNPDTDPQDLAATPGEYTVIVTDANGCTATITAAIIAVKSTPSAPFGISN